VEPWLPERGTVLDLGCGPGEITCELASRRTDLSFIGIDHSSTALTKAEKNISRRKVANVRFECRNVEEYTPSAVVDLVMLFDSFHHLTKPVEFVQRLGPLVKRWALIEPRGSWAGTWQKDVDFDWVAQDLDNIRAHVALLIGEGPAGLKASPTTATGVGPGFSPAAGVGPAAAVGPGFSPAVGVGPGFSPATSPTARPGAAVERRYTLDDFRRFFGGYALDLRGTIAGLESYPPESNQPGELRERFGELRYQLYRSIDEWLLARDRDLHAKHWLIVAERGGRSRNVTLPALAKPDADIARIAGPYDVRYGLYRGPRDGSAGARSVGALELTNEGWGTWASHTERPVFVSYHWLDSKGQIVEFDGERTPLPRPIGAGETVEVSISIRTPSAAGRYRLAIDLVQEGVTWFSQAGRPWLEVPFDVR
jgi:SAM-dependent methyltransferase